MDEYKVSWTITLQTKVKSHSFKELHDHLDKIDIQYGGKYVKGSMTRLEIEGLPFSQN